MKLGKSAIETLEMLREAFGEHSLSRTGFWMAFTFQQRSSVSWKWQTFRVTMHQQNDRKCWEKSDNSSTKTVAEQSMSSQTTLGSDMEFDRRS
jgi:hypothetical protein